MPQLARFTLRDEGRTIAVGKVLKYKPAQGTVSGSGPAKKEEAKAPSTTNGVSHSAQKEDLIYDMESGEMLTKEEHSKRKREREKAQLEGIAEEDEK